MGVSEASMPATDSLAWLRDWQRPEGPARVGIQVGHLQYQEAPEEQAGLRDNSGASAGGVNEVDINQQVAERMADVLQTNGVEVTLLPVTIPPGFVADAFISIHADGNEDSSATGYKMAGPWRDLTGKGEQLLTSLKSAYDPVIGLPYDENGITRNMRGYYAFAWWRYEHAIHPMTPAAIVELGFVTNPTDREIMVKKADELGTALARGVEVFLQNQGLLE